MIEGYYFGIELKTNGRAGMYATWAGRLAKAAGMYATWAGMYATWAGRLTKPAILGLN